ncbi:MAG: hypothetical protein OXC30_03325 [Alphaproteobacteria bacterium]|nr:hypothetical protein [Alphaproteobacteria bacterium]
MVLILFLICFCTHEAVSSDASGERVIEKNDSEWKKAQKPFDPCRSKLALYIDATDYNKITNVDELKTFAECIRTKIKGLYLKTFPELKSCTMISAECRKQMTQAHMKAAQEGHSPLNVSTFFWAFQMLNTKSKTLVSRNDVFARLRVSRDSVFTSGELDMFAYKFLIFSLRCFCNEWRVESDANYSIFLINYNQW